MAELADALDLGSSGQPWGFESPLSHQQSADKLTEQITKERLCGRSSNVVFANNSLLRQLTVDEKASCQISR